MAQFTYATNNSGGTANFDFRSIAAIPDRNIADPAHVMFYLPVLGADGKTWLNNNLGANYADTTKPSFNPAAQATASNDQNAYGSFFQWGRYSDGHELINWTSSSAGAGVNTPISGTSSSTTPGDKFLYGASNWYTGNSPSPASLWQGVTGTNNPCPIGYRIATETEMDNQRRSWPSNNSTGARNSPLILPMAGQRSTSGGISNGGNAGLYWTSTVDSTTSIYLNFGSSGDLTTNIRARGLAVRCLKD